MCGIIGIVGERPVTGRLIESLKRLEYRGYDSAGVAGVVGDRVERRRAPGKLRNLETLLETEPLAAMTGIGHTRWATHGAPTTANAHPQKSGRVTVVHNGIIENFSELKAELLAEGRVFESETDTEVVAQVIDHNLGKGLPPLEAFKATLDRLTGAYALGVMIDGCDELIMGARHGPPLVVGYGDGEMYLGSDALAVGPFTSRVSYLEDGDYVAIDRTSAHVFDMSGAEVLRPVHVVAASASLMEKGNYRHFMEKEIHDQPDAVQHTLSTYLDPVARRATPPQGLDLAAVTRLQIVACGTASYAGLIGKYIIERIAGLPVDVEVASEFRYREPALTPGTLAVAISQSGETADTLAAMRYCREQGLKTAAIVNVHTSTMARDADLLLPTNAGPEICVLSTKAFAAQISVLMSVAIAAGVARGRIDAKEERRLVSVLLEAPRLLVDAMQVEDAIREVAIQTSKARDVLYLGRGPMFALALEGALKLKEVSYIHAEGYAAGELKHGPIALVDEATPVVVIAPTDPFFEKTVSNMSEVIAREGPVVLITDEHGAAHAPKKAKVIVGPTCDPLIAPLVYSVPIQLLAYYVAVQKGTDVDQPRNLAKSVTVE
jgi:glucosamine--fructose-6-phosphate aminotransferase (isomerizing)